MNVKMIAALVIGGVVGYKVGERAVSNELGKWGGAAVGAFAGHYIGKKL